MLIIRKEQFDAFKIPFRKRARVNILHNIQDKEFHKVYEEGRNIVVEDSKGRQTRLHFAENFLPEKITKPSNTQYKLAFDEDDRLINFGFAGSEESLRLTYQKELLTNILLNDDIITINYDEEKRITEIFYPDNKSVKFTYNQNNELIALTNRAGETKQFGTSYHNGRFIYSIRDSLGRDTLFERNNEGSIGKIVFPDGSTEETIFNEDIAAEITTLRNGVQRITYYEGVYPSRIEYGDGNFVNLEVKENGQVESIENETGTINYEYDGDGKLLHESFHDQKVTYNYDADDLLTNIIYPTGLSVKYDYDEDGRLKTIEVDDQVVEYKYAANDTVSEIRYPNGLTEIQRSKVVSGLQESKVVSKRGETLSRQLYSYDNLTRLTEYLDQNNEGETKQWRFGYDDDSRLLSSEDIISQRKESFKYDNKGNFSEINQKQVIVGRMDELRSIGNSSIQYDGSGNVSSFINELGKRVELKFNDSGVLKFARIEDDEWEYWYDGSGRRIAKSNGKETYKYHWASEKLLSEEYNKTGNAVTLREYIYAPYHNIPIAIKENSNLFWFQRDVRGAITHAYDGEGETIWSTSYNAFGSAQISIEKIRQPWRLIGQYFDDETGLHYNFSRYYSPLLRSYLSIDPKWFNIEAINYGFCKNDPFNRIDPTANLSALLAIGGTIAGAAIGFCIAGPAGAAIGGIIAGGIVGALSEKEGPWWQGAIKGVTTSAIMEVGALSGLGLAGIIAGGAVAGIADSVMDDSLKNRDICIPCALAEGAIFAATAGLFAVVGKAISSRLASKLKLDAPHTNMTRAQKGVYGEHVTDVHMQDEGFEKLNGSLTKSTDAPKGKGIDGVWKNSNPPPEYIITESKYGSGKLNKKTKQMSDEWVQSRLKKEVGDQEAEKILDAMERGQVEKRLYSVDEYGNISEPISVDEFGKEIK